MSKELHTEELAAMDREAAIGAAQRITELPRMSREATIEAARRATGACVATATAWVDGSVAPIRRYRNMLDAAGLAMVGARSTAGTAAERRGRPRRGARKIIVVQAGEGQQVGDVAQLETELRERGFCVGDAAPMRGEAKTTPE